MKAILKIVGLFFGVGIALAIPKIGDSAVAGLIISPNPVNFSDTVTNNSSQISIFVTKNQNGDSPTIGVLVITGPNTDEFVIDQGCTGQVVENNQPCQIDITFTPTEFGERSATLVINSDSDNNPHQVSLRGKGIGCGDGVCQEIENNNTCRDDCPVQCGNGVVETDEECDDGDPTSGDGCSSTCTREPNFTCEGSPSVCTAVPLPDASPTGVSLGGGGGCGLLGNSIPANHFISIFILGTFLSVVRIFKKGRNL